MSEDTQLNFAGEFSLGYRFKCAVCGEELRSEKSPLTKWQTRYYTKDGLRHYKRSCNIKSIQRQRKKQKNSYYGNILKNNN